MKYRRNLFKETLELLISILLYLPLILYCLLISEDVGILGLIILIPTVIIVVSVYIIRFKSYPDRLEFKSDRLVLKRYFQAEEYIEYEKVTSVYLNLKSRKMASLSINYKNSKRRMKTFKIDRKHYSNFFDICESFEEKNEERFDAEIFISNKDTIRGNASEFGKLWRSRLTVQTYTREDIIQDIKYIIKSLIIFFIGLFMLYVRLYEELSNYESFVKMLILIFILVSTVLFFIFRTRGNEQVTSLSLSLNSFFLLAIIYLSGMATNQLLLVYIFSGR